MLDPSRPTLRGCARATRGGALITGFLLLLLPVLPEDYFSTTRLVNNEEVATPILLLTAPALLLGLWLGFTLFAYGVFRLTAADRVRARRRHAGLPLQVVSTFPADQATVGLAQNQPSLRLPARIIELRLRRADVPNADVPWDLAALPTASVRGRLAQLLGKRLSVKPHEVAAPLGAGQPDEAALEAAAAELVLLVRCFAEDDRPALEYLAADHPPPTAEAFAERLLDYAPDHPTAATLAARHADSPNPRLRALAALTTARAAPNATIRLRALLEGPLPPDLPARVWWVLSDRLIDDTDWTGLLAAIDAAPPDALGDTIQAVLDADHPGTTRTLVRCWRASMPFAVRGRLQAVLAARGALDDVLEAGLEVENARALQLALNHHAARHGAASLADRCAALLGVQGAVTHPDDPRPSLWLAGVGAGGNPAHLALLRRWATASFRDGRPDDATRLAAEAAVLRLADALPAAGALTVVEDEAAGGLSLAGADATGATAARRSRR